ncbi:glycerol-3-phosphate dehydrogenase [Candidatus Sumerlaeota bacterium]|nr:glycerol-3-phosphate dehydrogenase [Candidatus Sumerlaeota bacterium]
MKRAPSQLTEEMFDLLVVGGGISGAGACRDAALRGLRVALVEKGDFASGTSSASSKLIHGGLRYLEQMRLRLVRESLRERRTLLRIAPHLVRPLQFHIPIYRGQKKGRFLLGIGLWLYNSMGGRRGAIAPHRMLSRAEIASVLDGLHPDGLVGGAQYYDATMDDARLCLANLIDADRRGARVCNYVEATGVQPRADGTFVVETRDALIGEVRPVRARAVLNATGPWSDRFLKRACDRDARRLQTSKGVHLVFARPAADCATLLFAPDDRIFFVLPWHGFTIVGTTDTPWTGDPAEVRATPEDADYLLDAVSSYIGSRDEWERGLIGSFAGVRPLVAGGKGTGATYRVSREHLLVTEAPGFFSLVGGKYTTYRAMAESAIDAVCRHLKSKAVCATAREPLPGGDIPDFASWSAETDRRLASAIPDPEMRLYLMRTLGTEIDAFVERYGAEHRAFERIDSRFPVPRAMIRRAREEEMAMTDDDLLHRRTPLALLSGNESLSD